MPCDCEVDVERRWVRSRAWGVLTLAEGLAMRHKFMTHPAFTPDFYQLFDARDVTRIAITAVETGELAKDRVFSPQSRRAFVVPSREAHDFARMYQLFRGINAGSELIRTFRTIEEAEQWLAQ